VKLKEKTCYFLTAVFVNKLIFVKGKEKTQRDDEREDDGRAKARERADRITRSS